MFKTFFPFNNANSLIVFALAVALQIQVSLFAYGSYLGLRVNLADLMLPFLGVYVLISLFRKQSSWPVWSVKYFYVWGLCLAMVMTLALLNGYFTNGFLSHWALINKYFGFFILLSYLGLGAWIQTNATQKDNPPSVFMAGFSGFFIATIFMSFITFVIQYFVPFSLWLPDYAWDGFMANRNAFMVVFVMVFIFVIWNDSIKPPPIPTRLIYIFWLCLPTFLIYNSSRTAWVLLVPLLVFLFVKNPVARARNVLPVLLIGIVLAKGALFLAANPYAQTLPADQMRRLMIAVTGEEVTHDGDQNRFIAIEDGLDLYTRHNPFIGAGLGSYKPFQSTKRGAFIDVIDFTGLWLLVETGLLGLLSFAGFFIVCALSLYKQGYKEGSSPYHRAMLIFLIAFATISTLHEVMYTRFLWFAMGLALAYRKN